jgi:hypothetical protein
MKPIASNDRNQTFGPHPEEAALFARPSRRMATGTDLACGRPSRRAQERAPHTKVKTKFSPCRELENRLSYTVVGPAGGQLRTRPMDDTDVIRTTETLC